MAPNTATESATDSTAETESEDEPREEAEPEAGAAADVAPAEKGAAPAEAPARRRLRALLPELPGLAVALAVAIAFGLSFGVNYGIGNQTAYMLGALRKLDPTVLNADWYATGPANYHPAFAYVGWLLLALDRGGWGVGVGFVVAAAAGAMCIYWLARELLDRRLALAVYLLVMGVSFVTRTRSIAVSYIFEPILQPSTLGSLFLLAALPPFLASRYLLSGVFLGLSGLFHGNYLILGIGTFGLAHLALGVRDLRDLALRLLRQLGPSMVAFLILSPLIFGSVGSQDGPRAQEILFNIRSPHHYVPRTYKGAFIVIAAWQMIGLGAGAWLLRGHAGRGRRLGALILSLALIIWTGTLLTTWIWIPRVAQVFVWRFAPFQDLLMQLLLCVASVRVAVRPELLRRVSLSGLVLLFAGAVALAIHDKPEEDRGAFVSIALIVAPAILGVALAGAGRALERFGVRLTRARERLSRAGVWIVLPYAAVVCVALAYPDVKTYRRRSNLIAGFTGPEEDLYRWIRANTPKDAIFLSPPQMERFRLGAERAIVVDWKGSAYLPSELVEWYHRLENVSGRRGFRGRDDVFKGYAAMDDARLRRLKGTYKLHYAVVARGKEAALSGKVVYQNARFAVLDLRG